MSLLDSVRDEQQRRDNKCGVYLMREHLKLQHSDRLAEVEDLIASDYSADVVSTVLKRELDVFVSADSITRHRRDACRCR